MSFTKKSEYLHLIVHSMDLKTTLYDNITYIIPPNIRYLKWNTQYIAHVRIDTICALQVNTITRTSFLTPPA